MRWAESTLSVADSPSLAILAGLPGSTNPFELDALLERISRELSFKLPNREELPLAYARVLAEEIVCGRSSPEEGCRSLYALVKTLDRQAVDWPPVLRPWIGLEDDLYRAQEGVGMKDGLPEVEAAIVVEAERLLSAVPCT